MTIYKYLYYLIEKDKQVKNKVLKVIYFFT